MTEQERENALKDWSEISCLARGILGYTRAEFAAFMKVSVQTISRWETGNRLPKLQHLYPVIHIVKAQWDVPKMIKSAQKGEFDNL